MKINVEYIGGHNDFIVYLFRIDKKNEISKAFCIHYYFSYGKQEVRELIMMMKLIFKLWRQIK
jgi:bisphosphoglycerate-independent phosphoglycerate mutase (AlkP superfamily)